MYGSNQSGKWRLISDEQCQAINEYLTEHFAKRNARIAKNKAEKNRRKQGRELRNKTKMCPTCGNEFKGRRFGSEAKYCSHECYLSKGIWFRLYACIHCGKFCSTKNRMNHLCNDCSTFGDGSIMRTVWCRCGRNMIERKHGSCDDCKNPWQAAASERNIAIEWVDAARNAFFKLKDQTTCRVKFIQDPWRRKAINAIAGLRKRKNGVSITNVKSNPISNWSESVAKASSRCKSRRSRQLKHFRNPWLKTVETKSRNWNKKMISLGSDDRISQSDLFDLLERQGYRCALTGEVLTPDDCDLDHIVPVSDGGSHTIDNVQFVCQRANRSKGTMSNDEFIGMCKQVAKTAKRPPAIETKNDRDDDLPLFRVLGKNIDVTDI